VSITLNHVIGATSPGSCKIMLHPKSEYIKEMRMTQEEMSRPEPICTPPFSIWAYLGYSVGAPESIQFHEDMQVTTLQEILQINAPSKSVQTSTLKVLQVHPHA